MTTWRKGRCPSLAEPMRTGDGLLVRLPRPVGGYAPDGLARIAAAASRYGNGHLDISARGNLQVRGLSDGTLGPLRRALDGTGAEQPPPPGLDVNALAGLDPASRGDPAGLAQAIRARLAARAAPLRLAPKLSVVLDGGGALHLDALSADIRLSARDGGWAVGLGGMEAGATPLCFAAAEAAAGLVVALLDALAARGSDARGRDLAGSPEADALRRGHAPHPGCVERPAAQPVGRFDLAGTTVLGLGLPFGRVEAGALLRFCEAAGSCGAADLRPAAGRALLATGLDPGRAAALARHAAALDLIVDPGDPRCRIQACTGRPDCGSAWLDTRTVAALLAREAADWVGGLGAVHVSGCGKGCARPAPAALTLVGTPDGCAIVRNGTARSAAGRVVAEADLPGWIFAARRATPGS